MVMLNLLVAVPAAALSFATPTPCALRPLECLPRRSPSPHCAQRLDAIVLDADGTLLDPEHRLSPNAFEAIREAREAGIKVICATGRARAGPWVEDILKPLGLMAPGVFIQGLTAFSDSGERILNQDLDPSVTQRVQQICEGDSSVTVCAFCQETLAAPRLDARTEHYARYGEAQPEISEGRAAGQPWEVVDAVGGRVVNKLLILTDSADSVPALRERLEKALGGLPCRVVRALDWTLEILPEGSSKAEGVKALLASMRIQPQHVMAVGDGENDLELIQMVGVGVAMGNAVPALKQAADYSTTSSVEGGVANAIRQYALPSRRSFRRRVASAFSRRLGRPRMALADQPALSTSRRAALRCAAVAAAWSAFARSLSAAAAGKTIDQLEKGNGLSVAQVDSKLRKVPVVAIVNGDDQPFFISREGSRQVAYFFLDPSEALMEYRQLIKTQPDAMLKVVGLSDVYFPLVANDVLDVGGSLRLRPSRRQIVWANRALQYNLPEGSMIPVTLSEEKGQVPVFYSEKVAFDINGETRYPFFLRKEDLDIAFDALQTKGALEAEDGKKVSKANGPTSMPVGLVRVATLDGFVKQMRSGEVDLSQAIVVGSDDAIKLCKRLLADGSATGAMP
ncbi:hypothetical protein AB1Y20_000582 [Prymnesium parvum]|uniref:Uncharacterized protein n=1 Tax=Prymnesium parvum TaxID=97485 RepID=A0AB34K695_PRYPA